MRFFGLPYFLASPDLTIVTPAMFVCLHIEKSPGADFRGLIIGYS
jgi:hypothetical protein